MTNDKTRAVLEEVFAERERQVQQWGGVANDDRNKPHDWVAFITKQLGLLVTGKAVRERLIKVAALAVAAIEAYDRPTGWK